MRGTFFPASVIISYITYNVNTTPDIQIHRNVAQTPRMWYDTSMESILYICRLCLKAFRSHGWAVRHEEGCIGSIQVVMLDGPQIRPNYRDEMMDSAGTSEARLPE